MAKAVAERFVRAVVGLGSNVGDAAVRVRDALVALDELPGGRVVAVSRLYATAPVGVTDQPEFRNAVALVDVPAGSGAAAGALDLLVALKGLERRLGRRPRERWGPREIDLDLLDFGAQAISVERPPEGRSLDFATKGVTLLVVPHPAASARLFVLAPWADLEPDYRPPGWHETVAVARDRQLGVEGPRRGPASCRAGTRSTRRRSTRLAPPWAAWLIPIRGARRAAGFGRTCGPCR